MSIFCSLKCGMEEVPGVTGGKWIWLESLVCCTHIHTDISVAILLLSNLYVLFGILRLVIAPLLEQDTY